MLLSEDMHEGFTWGGVTIEPVRISTAQVARRSVWLIATSAPPPPARASRKSRASVPPRSP
jgi:hypothetical protein